MRTIDADDLKKALSNKDLITWTHEYGDAIPFDWMMNAIDNAPTVHHPNCDICEDKAKQLIPHSHLWIDQLNRKLARKHKL